MLFLILHSNSAFCQNEKSVTLQETIPGRTQTGRRKHRALLRQRGHCRSFRGRPFMGTNVSNILLPSGETFGITLRSLLCCFFQHITCITPPDISRSPARSSSESDEHSKQLDTRRGHEPNCSLFCLASGY